MTYKESIDYLFSRLPMFSRIGAAAYKPGLDTSIALDNYFRNPHKKFKSIHIGGTNGKGSTSHMLASILQTQGYKVGLYTSPHLADFRERMRINGEMIPEDKVVKFVENWLHCGYDGSPSFFELTMMMAFDWFAAEEVDFAVIEVGMGGRLDSTNIINPLSTVVTNISPDHMQFLGDSLEKIAAEKAGIFKPGVPALIGYADGSIKDVFQKKAAQAGSPIIFASDESYLINPVITEEGFIETDSILSGPFRSPLGGEYQLENINTVLHEVEILRKLGIKIDGNAIKEGLENVCTNTGLAGRWMIISKDPLTICDTGHNEAGLRRTMHQLSELAKKRKTEQGACNVRIVIGFVNDKDVLHIARLLPQKALYYVTQPSVPRAMDAEKLIELLMKSGLTCKLCGPGVTEAAREAQKDSEPNDIVYIGGSTFVVADFLAGL